METKQQNNKTGDIKKLPIEANIRYQNNRENQSITRNVT